MKTWRVKKILIIAEDDQGDEKTMELEHARLQSFCGMFWRTPASIEFMEEIYTHLPRAQRHGSWQAAATLKAMAPSVDEPALFLKDPDCGVHPWP